MTDLQRLRPEARTAVLTMSATLQSFGSARGAGPNGRCT